MEGVPGALFPSLSLRCVGHDEADVQLLQCPAELGGVASASKLLVEALGLFGGALEEAVPVVVEGQGSTVAVDDALEHQHVSVGILLLSEQGKWDRPGGVVHGADEGQVRSSALKPVVAAPIDLRQHPLLGIALPSTVSPGGLADAAGSACPQAAVFV